MIITQLAALCALAHGQLPRRYTNYGYNYPRRTNYGYNYPRRGYTNNYRRYTNYGRRRFLDEEAADGQMPTMTAGGSGGYYGQQMDMSVVPSPMDKEQQQYYGQQMGMPVMPSPMGQEQQKQPQQQAGGGYYGDQTAKAIPMAGN